MRIRTILLMIPILVVAPARAAVVNLDHARDSQEYRMDYGRGLFPEMIPWAGTTNSLGDLDGDGDPELIVAIGTGFMIYELERSHLKIVAQENLPLAYRREGMNVWLASCVDVDLDGDDEMLFTYRDFIEGRHGLGIIGLAGEPELRDIPLPVGEDINGDGKWDGHYEFIGSVPGALPDGRAGLLLRCVVGYDRYERGLRLHDPVDGAEIWRYEMGPNPTTNECWIGDVDDDGDVEIIASANSPNNLGDEKVNGTGDNLGWIFALEADGSLRWARPMGIHFFHIDIEVGDLTGDGLPELVSATSHHSAGAPGDTLTVWNPRNGEIIDQVETLETQGMQFRIGRGGRIGGILAANIAGDFILYELIGEHLEWRLLARATGPLTLLAHGEILADRAGHETVLETPDRRLVVLDRHHRVRVVRESPYNSTPKHQFLTIWSASPSPSYLVGHASKGRFGMTFRRQSGSPPIMPRHVLLATLALAIILPPIVILRRRRGDRSKAIFRREKLTQILVFMEDVRHGLFPPTEVLRELLKQIRNAAEDEGVRRLTLPRFRTTLETYREDGLPRLLNILDLAMANGLRSERARETRQTLRSTVERMQRLADLDLATDILDSEVESLTQACDRVENDLLSIRDAARMEFTAEPHPMLRRLLALREPTLEERGITLEFGEAEADGVCLIDSGDLCYVLENLVDNAIRALSDVREPKLEIALERIVSKLRIDVIDSGAGIPESRRAIIFRQGYTTKGEDEKGGSGLARSREMLRRWGGKLSLIESAEGRGSRFRLVLPLKVSTAENGPPRRRTRNDRSR